VTVIDTVFVKPDSLKGELSIDSLMSGKLDSLIHESASKDLTLKIWYDKYTRLLKYRADVKPRTIIQIKEVPVEVQAPCPDAVVADPERALTWRAKVWKNFQFFAAWLVLAGVGVILGYSLFKRALK
jgi:hypothetical protein